jgi:hypothetical protein
MMAVVRLSISGLSSKAVSREIQEKYFSGQCILQIANSDLAQNFAWDLACHPQPIRRLAICTTRHHSRLRSIPLPASALAASSPRITALRQIVEAGNSASSAISRTASTTSGGIKTQMRSNGSPPLRLVRVNLPSRPFSGNPLYEIMS